ncbi:MAG TPA: hypothetical protein VGL96_07535, partial [Casimicrobiaceae bacterium]
MAITVARAPDAIGDESGSCRRVSPSNLRGQASCRVQAQACCRSAPMASHRWAKAQASSGTRA